MLPKTEAKYIQSLSQKKTRAEYGEFVVEGTKLVHELLSRKPSWVKHLYGLPGWWASQSAAIEQKFAKQFTSIADFELEKISNLQAPQQVLAVVKMPVAAVEKLPGSGWILVLDGLQDPGNLGTIIRTAHWFGVKQIVCSPDCADIFMPKVVQATMGSIFCVQVFYKDLQEFFTQNKLNVYGALLQGQPIHTYSTEHSAIILIGNEGNGIRPVLLPYITHPVTIPGHSDAESLNAAIAAGIMLYHFITK